MSSEAKINTLNVKDYIREEENEKQYREQQIFLKNFNENFVKYKDKIKKQFYDIDQENEEILNKTGQPKYIYNNFPLIIGIIFIFFGFLLFFTATEKDTTTKLSPNYIDDRINRQLLNIRREEEMKQPLNITTNIKEMKTKPSKPTKPIKPSKPTNPSKPSLKTSKPTSKKTSK